MTLYCTREFFVAIMTRLRFCLLVNQSMNQLMLKPAWRTKISCALSFVVNTDRDFFTSGKTLYSVLWPTRSCVTNFTILCIEMRQNLFFVLSWHRVASLPTLQNKVVGITRTISWRPPTFIRPKKLDPKNLSP